MYSHREQNQPVGDGNKIGFGESNNNGLILEQLASINEELKEQRMENVVQFNAIDVQLKEQRKELKEQRKEFKDQHDENKIHFTFLNSQMIDVNEKLRDLKIDSGHTVEAAVRSGISSRYGSDAAQKGLITCAQDILARIPLLPIDQGLGRTAVSIVGLRASKLFDSKRVSSSIKLTSLSVHLM
jgi:vacuolar-type H+-ATPase subunit I/STV1